MDKYGRLGCYPAWFGSVVWAIVRLGALRFGTLKSPVRSGHGMVGHDVVWWVSEWHGSGQKCPAWIDMDRTCGDGLGRVRAG